MSDANDLIVLVDATLADALGYRPKDLIGRPAIGLVARTHRLAMIEASESLRRGDEPTAVVSTAFVTATGALTHAQVVLSVRHAVSDRRERAGLVCTVLMDDTDDALTEPYQSSAPYGTARPLAPEPASVNGASARGTRPMCADAPAAGAAAPEFAQLLKAAEATALAVQGLLAATNAAMIASTARQQAPEKIEPAPHPVEGGVDSLTGLATRATLLTELRDAMRDGADVAVLLVDLDEFKSVNDTHGHDIGDEVLVHVADRLRACVRPDDLVVRFGGDEFVILCRVAEAATAVASRVVSLLAPPIETVAGPIPITASVGISDASIPVDLDSDLLTRADTAMYWAKELGKNRYFSYDTVLHERVIRDGRVRRMLGTAVADRRIAVRYQPIVCSDGTNIIGVEAVSRLIDDDGQPMLPAEFLSVAESTGLISTIDAAVLVESCRFIGTLMRDVGQPLAVSVNVSRRFIARADLVEFVLNVLADAGVPAAALMLELTEEALTDSSVATIARLAELRSRGVQVALDNFGAGYAALSLLRDLPLTYVKVDRPCIARMMTSERDAALVEAVTWLVDRLGLAWIAEGVETNDEWQAVRRFGPGLAQGYLFAEPLTEDALARHLRAGPRRNTGRRLGALASA